MEGMEVINSYEWLELPEGNFQSNVTKFDKDDLIALQEMYLSWRKLCANLNALGARSVNLPEGLSEPALCLAKGFWRTTDSIPGANSSMDCYDPNGGRGNNRIQIKACSVIPDLTSFGPNTVWDRIYFVDFYSNGKWDGTFDVYELDTQDVYNYPVNASQTLREQQVQGRRPRFSIYKGLIREGKYLSHERFNLLG